MNFMKDEPESFSLLPYTGRMIALFVFTVLFLCPFMWWVPSEMNVHTTGQDWLLLTPLFILLALWMSFAFWLWLSLRKVFRQVSESHPVPFLPAGVEEQFSERRAALPRESNEIKPQ